MAGYAVLTPSAATAGQTEVPTPTVEPTAVPPTSEPEPPPPETEPPTIPPPPADVTGPAFEQPLDVVIPALDGTGALAAYPIPNAIDDVDGPIAVTCNLAQDVLIPIGVTTVTCTAIDSSGNPGSVAFPVIVTDQTPPTITQPANITVEAGSAAVEYPLPAVTDNVDASLIAACDPPPGSTFPAGDTMVTCTAQDAAGNVAAPVSFTITVIAPSPTPTPSPTDIPTTETPVVTVTPSPTATPTVDPSATPSPTPSPSTTPSPSPTPTEPPRPPLDLPPTPPKDIRIVTDGGPLGVLEMIWDYLEFPISQEYGHTEFSIAHPQWYAYGIPLGLDGFEHPGLDISMPAGTWLFSPVEGTVTVSGNSPGYTFYGNGERNVGQLRIRTDDGHEVILGHMGRIAVNVGDKVHIGQFVGLSGGENGDHLHLEVRERQPLGGWYKVVDPRKSFIVPILEELARKNAEGTPIPTQPPVNPPPPSDGGVVVIPGGNGEVVVIPGDDIAGEDPGDVTLVPGTVILVPGDGILLPGGAPGPGGVVLPGTYTVPPPNPGTSLAQILTDWARSAKPIDTVRTDRQHTLAKALSSAIAALDTAPQASAAPDVAEPPPERPWPPQTAPPG